MHGMHRLYRQPFVFKEVGVGLSKWEFPKIRGTFLGGLNNKDYSILGSILGCRFWETAKQEGFSRPERRRDCNSKFPENNCCCLLKMLISTRASGKILGS